MIPFFRKIRKKMADENKPMKYLRYAIGEIILVVIGILIALQIHNWNENQKRQAEIHNIYKQIVLELDNDIDELSSNLEYYNSLEPVFNKVISDSATVDLLDDGLSRLAAHFEDTDLNKSGIERLKTISVRDSLSLRLFDIYDSMENGVLYFEKGLVDEGWLIANNFRDKYDWYPEWMSKRITKDNSSTELQDYFVKSREYKHYAISLHNRIYNNYLPSLKSAKTELEILRAELQMRINK